MGWAVLYIAFGGVALWLLGEVLLQYKARLRWRLLAFGGFLCVVLGVLLPSVLVIALGAIAFATGQTYVTLSFRRGFVAGWAVRQPGAAEGTKRRRGRGGRKDAAPENPGPEAAVDGPGEAFGADDPAGAYDGPGPDASAYGHDDEPDDVFTPARPPEPTAAESTAVYAPQPLPDDTGSYGVYGGTGHSAGSPAPDPYAATAQAPDQGYGYDYSGYQQQGYGYDGTGQQQYAAYSDPYIGTQTYDGGTGTGHPGDYGRQGYGGQDQYAAGGPGGGYGGETPPGGVWVPQQRGDDPYGGQLPPEQQPYPYQGDGQGDGTHGQGPGQGQTHGQAPGHGQAPHGAGYDEQYRF
ncbi:hypothetical protein ACFUCQ_17465 [Streptomyces sp. NPDC057197]|uniref:SCO2102 family sporulation regulator n=1 Tax=Streptomyces sp. NPDC057197 TaxID=3346045 RepID=UPI00362A326F